MQYVVKLDLCISASKITIMKLFAFTNISTIKCICLIFFVIDLFTSLLIYLQSAFISALESNVTNSLQLTN